MKFRIRTPQYFLPCYNNNPFVKSITLSNRYGKSGLILFSFTFKCVVKLKLN